MTFESTLRGDLEALGADSRRDPLPLPETLRAGIYRDERPGAEARRNALLDQRRHELALMPLAYSHVFAHRVARCAAGAMAIACSLAMMLGFADPLLFRIAAWFVPGLDLVSCAALAIVAVLGAYIGGGWIAERVFDKKLRTAISLVGDLHADLDRLGEGPVDVARSLVSRTDGWAVGLVLAGTLSVAALFGFVTFVLGSYNLDHLHRWSYYAIQEHMLQLVVALVGGLVFALVVGVACGRRSEPRWLAHWGMFAAGGLLGLVTLYLAMHELFLMRTTRHVSSPSTALGLSAGGVGAVFLVATFAILWWRRREQARLA